jgi:hypothetical protein
MRSLFTLRILILLVFAVTPSNASLLSFWEQIVNTIGKYMASSNTVKSNCPTMGPDAVCTTDYAPVLCDEICTYSNPCVAQASGYVVDTHCRATAAATTNNGTASHNYLR